MNLNPRFLQRSSKDRLPSQSRSVKIFWRPLFCSWWRFDCGTFRVVIRGATLHTPLQICLSYFSVTDVLAVQGPTYGNICSSLKEVLTMISPLVCKLFFKQRIWSSLLWIHVAECWTMTLSTLYGSIGIYWLAHSYVQLHGRQFITL